MSPFIAAIRSSVCAAAHRVDRGIGLLRGTHGRGIAGLLLSLAVGFFTPACATTSGARADAAAEAAEVAELKEQVRGLERRLAEQRLRTEELATRLYMIEDRQQGRASDDPQARRRAGLPVVRLSPAPAAPGGAASSPSASGAPSGLPQRRLAPPARQPGYGGASAATNGGVPMVRGTGSDIRVSRPGEPVRPMGVPTEGGDATAAGPADAEGAPTDLNDQDLFDTGRAHFEEGRFLEAAVAFSRIGRDFPSSALVAPAIYWTGECFMAQEEYRLALDEFHKVSRIRDAAERPAALLGEARALLGLGRTEMARPVLERLRKEYPDSDAARDAVPLLANLPGDTPRAADTSSATRP